MESGAETGAAAATRSVVALRPSRKGTKARTRAILTKHNVTELRRHADTKWTHYK